MTPFDPTGSSSPWSSQIWMVPLEARPLAGAEAALRDLKAGKIVGRAVLQP